MIDEWEEFKAYTGEVKYASKGKRDGGWKGRFTFPMLLDFEGFGRILTILARGYLYAGETLDIDRALRALCAWCSIPEKGTAGPKEDWQYGTEFSVYHGEFPELVGPDGVGWLCRHVRRLCAFAKEHPEVVSKPDADRKSVV